MTAKTATQGQEGTIASLRVALEATTGRAVIHERRAWEGRNVLLGLGLEQDPLTGVSSTLMYRIEPDGSYKGV